MYHYTSDKKSHKKEPLEAVLKESLIVNPLQQKVQSSNRYRKAFNEYLDNDITQKIQPKTRGIVPKKGKLVKCPLKNILLGAEEDKTKINSKKSKPQPRNTRNQKTSTLDFVEKLKQIETTSDKNGFLEQTNEEIDIAFKQIEEIKKLLTKKMQNVEQIKRDYKRHECSLNEKSSNQVERLKKRYSNRTKIHYKSLKELEHVLVPQKISDYRRDESSDSDKQTETLFQKKTRRVGLKKNPNLPKRTQKQSEYSDDADIRKKLSILKERLTENENLLRSTTTKFASTKDEENQTDRRKKRPHNVRFIDKNIFLTSSSEEESIHENEEEDAFDTVDTYKALSLPIKNQDSSLQENKNFIKSAFTSTTKEMSCQTTSAHQIMAEEQKNKTGITEIQDNDKTKILFEAQLLESLNCESSDDMADYAVEDFNDEKVLPKDNKEIAASPLGDWFKEDIKLTKSIAKSDYLSREFSIDFRNKCSEVDKDKAGERKRMQLLETTSRNFRERSSELANLTERDQKLCETLNLVLKDTLFSEIV